MDTARERLLDTAEELIYRDGVHAMGTEAILDAAGTARMRLYNHFGSKEGLVVAALERRDERWMRWFGDSLEARTTNGRARLLAIYAVLQEWFTKPDFHGCAFINVSGEEFDKDHRTRVVARPHKEKLRACILRLCREAKVPRADVLARQLFLLVEGAIVAAMIEPKSTAAADARSVAAALRKAHAN